MGSVPYTALTGTFGLCPDYEQREVGKTEMT
jgi:hypothetical protein